MIVKKEIEIDLPDEVAAEYDLVQYRKAKEGETYMSPRGEVQVAFWDHDASWSWIPAPKREPLVTRIARAVLAGEAVMPVTGTDLRWSNHHYCWEIYNGNSSVCLWMTGTRELLGSLPGHCCGDPDTVLVADILAEVERLRAEGGEV